MELHARPDVEEPGRRIGLAPLGGQRRLELEVLVAPDQRIVDVLREGQEEGLLTGVRVHRADVARVGPFEGLGLGHRHHAETGAGDCRQRNRMPQTESHRVPSLWRLTHVAPTGLPDPWCYALTHTYLTLHRQCGGVNCPNFLHGYIRWTSPAGGRYRPAPANFSQGAVMNDVSRSFRGNSNAARDIAHHLHPYTNFKKHEETGPLTIVRGRGIYVTDDDGKEYIEGMAGLWSAALGFSNERLATVAYEQMKQLPFYHAFNQRSHEPAINLAEKLKMMAPVEMSKVFFANSGSEANDTVVKMVWYMNNALGRPNKKKIVSRLKGYHGITVASGSLTGLPNNHRSFDLPIAGVVHTLTPHYYRGAKDGETEDQFTTRCAQELEDADRQGRRRRPGRGHDLRAGDGCGRRDRAAQGLLREDPGGVHQVRHAVRRRRGDLRLRAHRQRLGQPDDEHQARHPDLRQGAVGVVPADLGGDGEREGLPGADERERQDRHLGPRLHLLGPSGGGRRRARGAEDLRRDRPVRPRQAHDARSSPGTSSRSPTIRWSARR